MYPPHPQSSLLRCLVLAGLLACSGSAFATTPAVSSSQAVEVKSPALWSLTKGAKEPLQIAERGGLLEISYNVDIKEPLRKRQNTVFETSVDLLLKEPVVIDPRFARLMFDARGQDGYVEARNGTVFIRPVLLDESGERFSYEPYRVDLLKEGPPDSWARWTTRPFLTAEAGGATQDVYEASGGNGNVWPDGKLRFAGFELRFRVNIGGNKPGIKKGKIVLGEVKLAPQQLRDDVPGTFADAFLQKKGRYQAQFEVRPAFQALPVESSSMPIDFDPADENARKQIVSVPLAGKLANSWVRYRFVDEAGQIAADGDLRYETNHAPESDPKLTPEDAAKPPVIGLVRINPQQKVPGVYAPDEPLKVQVRVFPAKPAAELKWKLLSYAFDTEIASGKEALNGAKPFQEVTIPLKEPPGQAAFRLAYTLTDKEGTELDRGVYILGKGGSGAPVEAYRGRQGILPDRTKLKEAPYNRVTFHDGAVHRSAEDELDRFTQTLVQSGDFSNHITYMVDTGKFEILPGVFDFSLLDKIMDAAADHRFGVTVRFNHMEARAPYLWLPYSKVRDADGSVIPGHYLYKVFAMGDGSYMDSWVRAFKALHDRYREHPGFEGYYLMMPGGEWVLPEEIWHGRVADYSWGTERAFRQYLQKDLGLDLAKLNARWGANLASWDDVRLPQPQWQLGTAPDLRPEWLDFSRFKRKQNRAWCIPLAQRIREFDDQRVIISYGAPDTLIADDGSKPIDFAHNGGNHFLKNEGRFVNAWDHGKGIGWITEPHHPYYWAAYGDPAESGWVLDWSVFVMFSQAGGGGANLHVYYHPNPTYNLTAHYGGLSAYDRMEQFKPILRELHEMEIVAPQKQVATFDDPDTLFTKHRTTYTGRMSDLQRWFELLTADSVPWEPYAADNSGNYKMIAVNVLNEVLSGTAIETLDRAARDGATLVVSANTGRYCSDTPKASYPLLTKMGIEPPTGKYVTQGREVTATVEPAYRETLGREAISFYTQEQMLHEFHDPAIGAKFNLWPYRWLPQSDYFGYFAGQKLKSGEVLARFSDGGVALSRHSLGKGSVVVFWGTPDATPARTAGLLGKLALWSGVTNPQAGNSIPYMLEGKHRDLKRFYALLYQSTPGTYVQKLPSSLDGKWFADDMLSGQKLGTFDGKSLRENGISVNYEPGASPLKVLRFYQPETTTRWLDKYPH